MDRYERDMIGYGKNIPKAKWPNEAKIAVQFVINYEEGGENCVLHGDGALSCGGRRAQAPCGAGRRARAHVVQEGRGGLSGDEVRDRSEKG